MTTPGEQADLFSAFLERWRELARSAGTPATEGWNDALERMLSAQSLLARTASLSFEAWRDLAGKAESGSDWQRDLMAYGERIQRQLLQGSEAWQAASPFSTLPSFGPAGDFARRLTQAFDGWVEWNRANAAYQTLLAELWRRAFERFLVELVEKGQAATTPDSVRALTEAFLETAEALFVEEFETDRYVEAQGRVLKAWSEYSARTQDVVDGVLKFGQVPSRSEVDSTAKTVHDLRREVRELRRELRELRREAGEPAAKEAEV